MVKRILFSLLVLVVLFSSVFARVANAQVGTPWYNQSYRVWSARVFDHTNDTEIFGERYTFAQVQWIVYSLMTIAAGSDLVACTQFLNTGTVDVSDDTVNRFQECIEEQGPIEEPTTYDSLLNPMLIASGVGYIRDNINNFHLIPEAQAQGFGYGAINPIQNLWRAMRNIAYLLLTVGIIIMSFMIMFRVKISPQAVISVQSALPRVVAALLAITFSYAIVGLMIDLIYIVIGGLSATAYRMKEGLLIEGDGKIFNDICYEATIPELIEATHPNNRDNIQYLSKLISKNGVNKVNLENVHIRAGEYKLDEMQEAFLKNKISLFF